MAAQSAKAGFEEDAAALVASIDLVKSRTPGIVPQPEPPAPAQITYVAVNACWMREASAQADVLGLPGKICIQRVGIEVPPDRAPIENPRLLIEGSPVSGSFHAAALAVNGEAWTVIGEVLSSGKDVIGREINTALLTVAVDMDAEGRILPKAPEVRGILAELPSSEDSPKAREFLYSRIP